MTLPTAKIIFDVPTVQDGFDGGGHRRSAKALAEGIDQVFQDGGGAIGLEGAWGSGKSSVIQMAEAALKESHSNDRSYHIFTFDLWTHQTDEFRRAFLERFLDFLEASEFPHKVDLEEERDRVRNRKKEVTNESKQRYTAAGAFIVLLLPFLPLIYAWLHPTAFVNVDALKLVPVMVLVVATASILVTLVMIRHYYLGLPKALRDKQTNLLDKFVLGASEFLTLSKNVQNETSVQWIRDEDPTTVEFQKTFGEILGKAQSDKDRLVFVLDNIDRLGKDAAKEAWSEMRALLAGKNSRTASEGHRQPVTVVVPYDREIIAGALLDAHNDGDIFAKTFNRILRVSPPLGSHWVHFLNRSLKSAFGDQLDEGQAYRLHRILQYHLQVKNLHATPRQIIGYVNDLGSYWSQWGGVIAIEAIGVFVLRRHELEKEFSGPTAPTLDLGGYSRLAKSTNLLRELAALHFNVDPSLAEEVLLATPLSNALTAGSPDALKKMQDVEGFERFFPRFLGPCMANQAEQAASLSNAARNIAALGLKGALAEEVASQMAEYLPSVTGFITDGSKQAEDIRSGLVKIVEAQSPQNILRTATVLKERYVAALSASTELDEFAQGLEWARYVLQIAGAATRSHQSSGGQFWRTAFDGGSAEFALGAAYQIESDEEFSYLDLSGLPPLDDVIAAMLLRVTTNPRVVPGVLRETSSSLSPETKASIVNAVASRMRSETLDEEDASYLIDACEQLFLKGGNEKPLPTALQKLLSDGSILYYTHLASGGPDTNTIAAGLFLLTKHYRTQSATPAAEPHPVLGALVAARNWYDKELAEASLPSAVLKKLAQDVAQTGAFGIWLSYCASQPAGSLFYAVMLQMVTDGELGSVGAIATAALVENYEKLRGLLSDSELQQVVKAMGDASSKGDLVEDEDLFSMPIHLVEHLQEWTPGTHLANLTSRIDDRLRRMTSEEWTASLGSEGDAVQMLISRIETTQLTLSPGNYLSGYKASALNVLSQDSSIGTPPERWRLLYEAVPRNSRRVLAQQVMIDLPRKGAKPAGVAAFVESFTDLATALPFEEYPETAIQVFLRELVLANSEAGDAFVRTNMKGFRKAVKKLADGATTHDAVSAFNDVLDELGRSTDEDDKAWAAELRKGLGIPETKFDSDLSTTG